MRLILALLCCWCLRAGPATLHGPVLFLSFDGLGARLFTAESMPRIWKLAQGGWRGEGIPPFPSTTFAGHATLATGCWPEHHGIVGNQFWDPKLGLVPYAAKIELLGCEPLWIAAARSGVKAAVYHWPCGSGPWHGQVPWRMEFFAKARQDEEAVDFCEAALAEGAQLIMAYLGGVDSEGHHFGPGSPEVRAKLHRIDELMAPWIGRMLAKHPGLRVVLAADHGMMATPTRLQLRDLLGDAALHVASQGGSAFVDPAPGKEQEAMRRMRAAGLTVWQREELPERHHLKGSPRAGALIVEAPPGVWMAQESWMRGVREKRGRVGTHGYLPERPEMHAWLVVLGAGQGELGEVPLWDLAPTIGAWLGIHWDHGTDGKPVQRLLGPTQP